VAKGKIFFHPSQSASALHPRLYDEDDNNITITA